MSASKKLILASTSPQRASLLKQLGLEFEVHALAGEEDMSVKLSAHELVRQITQEKAQRAFQQLEHLITQPTIVLCADTLVAFEEHRLGKASSRREAQAYLRLLSGNLHQVYTGIAVFEMSKHGQSQSSPQQSFEELRRFDSVSVSQVKFISLDSILIDWYLDSQEWQGAAGAYKIQGRAAGLIESIEGSYTGIVGLSLETLLPILRQLQFVP